MNANHLQKFFESENFILFKKPRSGKLESVLLKRSKPQKVKDLSRKGFYLAPFDIRKHPIYLFPEENSVFTAFQLNDFKPEEDNVNVIEFDTPNREDHIRKVKKAIQYIEKGEVKKLVISSPLDGKIKKFDPFCTFLRMALQYPDSFIFYVHIKDQFSMMGASPEVLFQMEKSFGTTYSLAGTRKVEDNISWDIKEIQEQELVTVYIKDILLKHKLPMSVDGPYTHLQGHLAHLRTDFQFILPTKDFDISKIVFDLHPTPAVAGIPKDKAMKLIPEIEQYDRAYYTGFLGMKNDYGVLFHVNLRSMQITGDKVRLYAGGGITDDSDPESEWEEVLAKWQIMKKLLV